MNRDPSEENGGDNLYGYIVNNPICQWDYLGLWTDINRDKDSMYGTTCASSGDTAASLVKKLASDEDIHLEASEALGSDGWLRQDRGNAVTTITAGKTYRIPNSIHITYGNMVPSPLPVEPGVKSDMRQIGRYLTSKKFYVVNHVGGTGMKGNSLSLINRMLRGIYTAGWAHGGHGHAWTDPKSGSTMSRGAIVLGNSVKRYPRGPHPDGHTHSSITPHHKLSIIILNVCYGGVNHENNWFNILASGGTLRASKSIVYPGGPWSSPGWQAELKIYTK